MSIRNQLKQAEASKNPPYYLVYFKQDKTVSVIKATALVGKPSELEPGSLCHVKEKKVIYDGIVVTSGTKEDVINVEEQFLDGIYNPDFIEEPSSDDDTDGVSLDEKNINSNERDGVNGDSKSDKLAKRKRNDSGEGKQPKKYSAAKQKEKKKEGKKEQQSKITITAVSTPVYTLPNETQSSYSESPPPLPETLLPNSEIEHLKTSECITMACSTPLSSGCATYAKFYNDAGSFHADTSETAMPLPPPIDSETINSLIFRINRLESQIKLCLSQCSIIMNHLFGTMVLPSILPESPLQASTINNLPLHSISDKTPGSVISQLALSPALQPPETPYRSVVTQSALQQDYHESVTITQPSHPVASKTPPQPVGPVTPSQPVGPVTPSQPDGPVTPQPITSITNGPVASQSLGETVVQPAPVTPVVDNSEDVLIDPDEVIRKYPRLNSVAHAGRLAVRLATESYFGDKVLRNCTVYGQKGQGALPKEKLTALKKKLAIHYKFYDSVEFEPIWSKCVGAINHRASALRIKKPIALIDLS